MTALFLVVKTRTEETTDEVGDVLTRHYYQRADGTGPEFGWLGMPAGAVFVLEGGDYLITIWADKAKTRTTGFRPSQQKGIHGGWGVSGEAPNLTVTPDVWVSPPNGWHGFVKAGQLVDA